MKKNKKRGFTLPEVVISFAITIIVMSLVASLVVVVSSISQKRTYQNSCDAEYRVASGLVNSYASTFSSNLYFLKEVTASSITVSDGENDYSLVFDQENLTLSADLKETNDKNEAVFEKISVIKFTKNEKIILCEYVFEDYLTYSSIIEFGAIL